VSDAVRRPCSDFMDMLRRLINDCIIIIIILVAASFSSLTFSMTQKCVIYPRFRRLCFKHQSVVGPSGPHNLCFPRFQRCCPLSMELTPCCAFTLVLHHILSVVFGCLGGAAVRRRTRDRKVAGSTFDSRPGHCQVN